MPLQTENLIMVGLGIQGDTPPNPHQPPLPDGVHLRWIFQQELGFPWHGFYLFSRPHEKEKPICLSLATDALRKGNWPDKVLDTKNGRLRSDTNLVLTDDFSPARRIEFDLSGRKSLRFELPSNEPAYRVDVRLGFRESASTQQKQPTCVDFSGFQSGAGPNPRIEQGLQFAVRGQPGTAQPQTRIDLRNTTAGPLSGLNCVFQLDITLPAPASFVELTLSHSVTPAKIDAFNADGSIAGTTHMQTQPNQPETVRIDGTAITHVVAHTPGLEVWLHSICFAPISLSGDNIQITALMDDTEVGSVTVTGQPGQIVSASLEFDAISAIDISPGAAALVDVCFTPVAQSATRRWQPVLGFPYPMCLPVTHPDYPCSGGAPVNLAAAEALALGRLRYGPPAPWSGANFAALHASLLDLVVGGPAGVPMAERTKSVPATPTPLDATPPTMPNQRPLDLVLLSTLHPALAQMVGLYWVDSTPNSASPAVSNDYLIVADYTGVGGGDPAQILSIIANSGFSQLEGYIVFNKLAAPAAPLPAPGGLRAFALPGGTFPNAGGVLRDAQNNAGLRWELGVNSAGELEPNSPILYHVWRADLGNGATPAAAGAHNLITNSPVLITEPDLPPGATLLRAADWPPFPLHFIDPALTDGWYSYQVTGIDIFGRHSPNSNSASWHQWGPPVPDPRPWYYHDPPGEAQIHPSAVWLLDKIPPSLPTAVEAYALDPADPTVLKDAVYETWLTSLDASEQKKVIGLRVRWKWIEAHRRQAPDTREFRIYYHPGTNPPAPDHGEAINWQERYYVVGYDEHVTVTSNGTRLYEVLLPDPADTFRDGLALTPSLAEPIVYAHIGVSAADDKTQTADDPKWLAGRWGDRFGNEGRVSAPAKIFRVLRTPPDPPVMPPDAEKVFATRADYHSRSFYTYRWRPVALLNTHIFRAMDDTLFKTDWSARPRPDLTESQLEFFPDETIDSRWNTLKRQQVADDLNQLNTFAHDDEGTAKALAYYRGTLSDDALRILAGLPGNERAFTQLTINPLDPGDSANANRRGPDNDDSFVVDPALCAYVDTLDGRATNRYFYRASYVDGAHNRSKFSLSSPPVYLPNVAPPRAPFWASSDLGDASATLHWASNREPDLVEYLIFRTESASDARDLRLMQKIHTVTVPAGAPEQRPATVSWTDTNLVGGSQYFYRIAAVDAAGNVSTPSKVLTIVAVDTRIPDPPMWLQADWVILKDEDQSEGIWPVEGAISSGNRPAIRLSWKSEVVEGKSILTRRIRGERVWKLIASESDYKQTSSSEYFFYDEDVSPSRNYSYRIRVISPSGISSLEYHELEVGRPRTG